MNAKPKATPAIAQASPYAAIFAVSMACIPVMSTDRSIRRKDQAALARQLFKRLGIKGVSVTTPNYSMAQSVDVRLPTITRELGDLMCDSLDWSDHSYGDMPEGVPAKQKHLANWEARKRIEAILGRAFPNHGDRSDTQSDHFDYCWSLS